MSDSTSHLALPFLLPSQAQKHVTHNEALRILDGLVQLSVLDRDLATPPDSSADGDRYIVGPGATGAWTGWDGDVASFAEGGWTRLAARPGWRAWVEDEGALVVHDGAGWAGTTSTEQQNLSLLGIGTAADAANPFAAKLNAALWSARTAAEGGSGNLRYALNQEAAGNVLSILLQTGWSGRAELGLVGDDNFVLKVSPDGETWHDALVVDAATGTLRGYLPTGGGTVAGALGVGTGDAARIEMKGAASSISVPPGAALAIRQGTAVVAQFDAAGPSSPGAQTALTREKGDARYVARGVNAIGSTAFLRSKAGAWTGIGQTRPASSLAFVSFNSSGAIVDAAFAPAGTWASLTGCGDGGASMWERIS